MLKVISCGVDETLVNRLDRICGCLGRKRNDLLKEMVEFFVADLEEQHKGRLQSIIMLPKVPVSKRDLAAEVEALKKNDPERPSRCPVCGAQVKYFSEDEGSCTEPTCRHYNARLFQYVE